jgi:diguanylate cyclase (GGDEF)-like protein/PAS domain S-box-containing protein
MILSSPTAPPLSASVLKTLSDVSLGLMISDPEGRLIYCNAYFSEVTGFTPAEVAGQACTFLQGPETNRETIERINLALRHERSFSGEILNYRKDGSSFWNELTLIPRHDDHGELTNFIGILRDVTAHRPSAPSAVVRNEHVQFVLDHIQSGIVLHRGDSELVYANEAAVALLGIERDVATGALQLNPVWSFIKEDGSALPVAEYPVSVAIRTREPLRNCVVGAKAVGDQPGRWFLCNAYPIMEGDGPPRDVIVSFTEITDLKAAIQQRQKSEERLRLILRGINDAPWDWDMVTGDLYYSRRWWEMMGIEPPEESVAPDFWIERLHLDDRERVKERLAHWLNSDTETYEIEFRLLHQDGYYVPVLSRGVISRDAGGTAVRISGALMDLTERKRHEAQLYALAYHDPLTGLPNRRLFNEKLQHVLSGRQAGHPAAVLCVDIDHFKGCNDAFGFQTGDEVLQMIAQRLQRFAIGADMVARLGSDEFAIIFADLGVDRQYAGMMAGKVAVDIQRAIGEPIAIGEVTRVLSASIGVVIIDESSQDMAAVLKQAEAAMYSANSAGRGMLRFFDPKIQDDLEERLVMAREFGIALEAGQLVPSYQAKVRDGVGIIGAECLIRWEHPTRGSIPPDVFIPFCEESGLIGALGRYVLTLACRQLKAWGDTPDLAHLTLSVNVSNGELRDPDYEVNFAKILADTGVKPQKLILEITESVLADDAEMVNLKIQRLRERGVKFSLDDFGTGYSSLSMLLQMKLDELKIDRSFVTAIPDNLNACKVSGIIIDLARQLGLNVVAEGIETSAQLAFLRSRTCSVFQGYLFARPTTLADFEALVRLDPADGTLLQAARG